MPSMVQNILRCRFLLVLMGLIGLFGSVGLCAGQTTAGSSSGEIYRAFHATTPNATAPYQAAPVRNAAFSAPSRQAVPLATVMGNGAPAEPERFFEEGNSVRHGQPLPMSQPAKQADVPSASRIATTGGGDVVPAGHLGETQPGAVHADKLSTKGEASVSSQNTPTRLPPAGSGHPSTGARLPPKGESNSEGHGNGTLQMLVTMGGSLLLVLGVFFLFAWMMRRTSRRTGGLLPEGVVEVLGHQPLAGRQQVHLVRIGNRILLISVMQDSVETLTEITDPTEVDRIAGICRQTGSGSSTGAFQAVMRQFSNGSGQVVDQPPTVDQLRQRLGT